MLFRAFFKIQQYVHEVVLNDVVFPSILDNIDDRSCEKFSDITIYEIMSNDIVYAWQHLPQTFLHVLFHARSHHLRRYSQELAVLVVQCVQIEAENASAYHIGGKLGCNRATVDDLLS